MFFVFEAERGLDFFSGHRLLENRKHFFDFGGDFGGAGMRTRALQDEEL
jgi:hypothetical protein